MTADSYHMPDQAQLFCPKCQTDLTLAKHERGQVRQPRGGDNSVCGHCLAYLCYVEPEPGVLRLDAIGEAQFEALPEAAQAGLMQARGELLAAREQGQGAPPTRYERALLLELTRFKERLSKLEATRGCSCDYCLAGDGLNCMRRRRA